SPCPTCSPAITASTASRRSSTASSGRSSSTRRPTRTSRAGACPPPCRPGPLPQDSTGEGNPHKMDTFDWRGALPRPTTAPRNPEYMKGTLTGYEHLRHHGARYGGAVVVPHGGGGPHRVSDPEAAGEPAQA